MLKSIDILIGLAVIMLAVSMAVTLVTQALIYLFQSRGRHLLRGIADLLEQVHPDMTREIAEHIAGTVLRHPLIREGKWGYGSVIHREELTKMLMGLASQAVGQTAGPVQQSVGPGETNSILRQKSIEALKTALKDNGIRDPRQTLENVRALALQLEKTNPELANNARQNLALLHEASSEFVAKINTWFDQTIDRVTERFTFTTRLLTFASALLVAVVIPLDTVSLVNRLAMDDKMRDAFVQQATAITTDQGQTNVANPDEAKARQYYAFLAKTGVISLPSSAGDWKKRWGEVNLGGVLVSILLLSLGAPFWYSMLNKLLRLRSVVAQKDDQQRQERQSSQEAVATPVGPAPVSSSVLVGERGDTSAVG